jgi:hypothetical protein
MHRFSGKCRRSLRKPIRSRRDNLVDILLGSEATGVLVGLINVTRANNGVAREVPHRCIDAFRERLWAAFPGGSSFYWSA